MKIRYLHDAEGALETSTCASQSSRLSRRNFLRIAGLAGLGVVEMISAATASQSLAQSNWRYCQKCHGLFYNGGPFKGRCPGGDAHEAQGFTFVLEHGSAETPNKQNKWRGCSKCCAMFFNGYPKKGRCAAGGEHVADRVRNYTLQHSLPGNNHLQPDWRFCGKCYAMFFDGDETRGRCGAGGAHIAQGFNFALPH